MHIGIVHYAAPPTVGGVEQTIFHHARLLLKAGHEVTVLAGQGAAFLPGLTFHQEPLAGSRQPEILTVGQALARGMRPPEFNALIKQLRARLLDTLDDCDVIIGHNLFTLHKNLVLTAAVHELVASGEGAPWVAWHHDFAWLRPQYQAELHAGVPWDWLRQPWPGVAHVTVSAAQQADLAQLYGLAPERIEVIPPGVDLTDFLRLEARVAQLAEEWKLLEADCLFLLPARITRRKNIELGLRWLAAIIERSGWDARLLVTGPPGPHNPANNAYLQELLALRNDLGLGSKAHFVYEAIPTSLTDREMASLYELADALLFPSQQEGFGIPLLEAALARLPIFASDLPPFRESAGADASLFEGAQSPQEVAHLIITTLEADRASRLRRRVRATFAWRHLVEKRLLPLLAAQADRKGISSWKRNS